MSDDTPARSPSARRMSIWSVAQAWLAAAPTERRIEIRLSRGQLLVTAFNQMVGASERVGHDEDPSGAAARAIAKVMNEP